MAADQTLKLRVAEIIHAAEGEITEAQATETALRERFADDYEALLKYAVSATRGAARALGRQTYELPDIDQGALFDIPQVIAIRKDGRYTFIHRTAATVDHARQWVREARRHHATQDRRFEKFEEQLKRADGVDGATLWTDFRISLAQTEPEADE